MHRDGIKQTDMAVQEAGPGNQQKERLWNKSFTCSFIALSLISLCNYLFYSTLPIYARTLIEDAKLLGYVAGVYSFFSLAAHLLSGYFSDRYGNNLFSSIGLVLCAIGCGGYIFSHDIITLLVFRSVHGLGFGMFTTVCTATCIGYMPRSKRNVGISYLSLYSTFSSALGPEIALRIISDRNDRFGALFLLALGIVALAGILFVTGAIRSNHHDYAADRSAKKPPSFHFPWKQIFPKTWPALIMFLLCLSQSSIISYLAVYTLDIGIKDIGIFFTVASVAIFIGRAAVGKVKNIRHLPVLLLFACFMAAVSLGSIAIAASKWLMVFLAIPYGFSFGMAGPIVNILLIENLPEQMHGTSTSFFHASLDLGIGIGSILMGIIGAKLGYQSTILVASGVCFCTFVLMIFISGRTRNAANSDMKEEAC